MRSVKSDIRKMEKYLHQTGAISTIRNKHSTSSTFETDQWDIKTSGYVWQVEGKNGHFDARQKWLVEAGWDPAGWVFLNWHQLPSRLKIDLSKVSLKFILETIEERSKQTTA